MKGKKHSIHRVEKMSSLTLGGKNEKKGNLCRKGSPVVREPRGAFNLVLAVGLRKNYELK